MRKWKQWDDDSEQASFSIGSPNQALNNKVITSRNYASKSSGINLILIFNSYVHDEFFHMIFFFVNDLVGASILLGLRIKLFQKIAHHS